MTSNARKQTTETTFQNPDTRERWEWVQQAISVAEDDSQRAFEIRSDNDVAAAASPFSD
ncbi:MAG: hypothetical protein AAFO81_12830 [Pseudomonadota bacterium]